MEPNKLKSRKFWFALLGAVLPIAASTFSAQMPLNEAIMASIAVCMSYIFGQGYVDGQKNKTIEQPMPES